MRPRGLLGTNVITNRRLVHLHCALEKNKVDLPRIAKAKAQTASAFGYDPGKAPIHSRGFPRREKVRGQKHQEFLKRMKQKYGV